MREKLLGYAPPGRFDSVSSLPYYATSPSLFGMRGYLGLAFASHSNRPWYCFLVSSGRMPDFCMGLAGTGYTSPAAKAGYLVPRQRGNRLYPQNGLNEALRRAMVELQVGHVGVGGVSLAGFFGLGVSSVSHPFCRPRASIRIRSQFVRDMGSLPYRRMG